MSSTHFIAAMAVGGVLAILVAVTTGVGYAVIATLQWLPAIIVTIFGRLTSPEVATARLNRLKWYKSPVLWLAVLIIPIVASGFF